MILKLGNTHFPLPHTPITIIIMFASHFPLPHVVIIATQSNDDSVTFLSPEDVYLIG